MTTLFFSGAFLLGTMITSFIFRLELFEPAPFTAVSQSSVSPTWDSYNFSNAFAAYKFPKAFWPIFIGVFAAFSLIYSAILIAAKFKHQATLLWFVPLISLLYASMWGYGFVPLDGLLARVFGSIDLLNAWQIFACACALFAFALLQFCLVQGISIGYLSWLKSRMLVSYLSA